MPAQGPHLYCLTAWLSLHCRSNWLPHLQGFFPLSAVLSLPGLAAAVGFIGSGTRGWQCMGWVSHHSQVPLLKFLFWMDISNPDKCRWTQGSGLRPQHEGEGWWRWRYSLACRLQALQPTSLVLRDVINKKALTHIPWSLHTSHYHPAFQKPVFTC